ncbi:MAG TPA: RagB/SusD family nutrient uptake outer membrane protein, partial [Chryseosolibacter sp.]
RNIELCFEFDRWFDLVRKRMLTDVAGQYLPNVSDNDYLYPIPNYDSKIVKSQNPGYTTE